MVCIVQKRGDYRRYDVLHRMFGSTTPVVWDQRRRERRRTSAASTVLEERRKIERRGPAPLSWVALGFIVVERPY
jgi:hypothetical protein